MASKGLTIQQIEAAKLLAKGDKVRDVWGRTGIPETSYHRLARTEVFQEAVLIFKQEYLEAQAAIAAAASSESDIDISRQDELEIRQLIKPTVEGLCGLTTDLIERVRGDAETELPARMLPQLIGAVSTAIDMLRTGNDRLTGLEALLDELGQIDETISRNAIALANTSESKAG